VKKLVGRMGEGENRRARMEGRWGGLVRFREYLLVLLQHSPRPADQLNSGWTADHRVAIPDEIP